MRHEQVLSIRKTSRQLCCANEAERTFLMRTTAAAWTMMAMSTSLALESIRTSHSRPTVAHYPGSQSNLSPTTNNAGQGPGSRQKPRGHLQTIRRGEDPACTGVAAVPSSNLHEDARHDRHRYQGRSLKQQTWPT